MRIFYPEKITEKILEEVFLSKNIDINFAYYEVLLAEPLWPDLVKKIMKKNINSVSFNVRLEKDSEGNFIKSWGNMPFLELIKGKPVKKFEVVNADTLENVRFITGIHTLTIRQILKNKLDIEPILSQKETLEKLYLEKNVIGLQVLKELNKLEFLDVTSIKLDVKDICKLDIEVLQVMRSSLVNTDYFKFMHNLKQIYFYGDKSEDYGFLEHIPNLKYLAFDGRKKFVRLPPLSKLHALEHIGLEGVGAIENLEELRNCKNLKTFMHNDSINQPEDYLFLNDMNLEDCKIYFTTNKKQNKLINLLPKYW